MRSDNGESWYEHPLAATEEAVSDALGGSLEGLGSLGNQMPGSSVSSLWSEHAFCPAVYFHLFPTPCSAFLFSM